MKRLWLGLSAVPVLGVSTWLAVADPAKDAGWTPVLEQDLVLGVEVTGTLRALESSLLGPPRVADMWDFKLAFMAPEGNEVKAGTPVLGFDASQLERQLEEKMAEAEAAGRELDKRRADLDLERKDRGLRRSEAEARKRKADLQLEVPPELVSATELSDARRDKALAENELRLLDEQIRSAERSATAAMAVVADRKEAAAGRVAQLQAAIASMQLTAPRDGTVVYAMNPWSGEKKKPGDSCWQGETVMEIPDLRSMKGEGEVDEADAGRVQSGQAVIFHLDAHPEVPFRGRVAAVHRTVQQLSWRNPLKVVRLDVALDATDPKRMRPGMRFRGKIELERIPKVRAVPAEAVFSSSEGPVVYRRTWLGWEPVRVEVGRRNSEWIEVKGVGLGDQVARVDLGARARRAGSAA
jgi:HlyD family secretion protein